MGHITEKGCFKRGNSKSEPKINVYSSTVYQVKREIVTRVVEHHQVSRKILNLIERAPKRSEFLWPLL